MYREPHAAAERLPSTVMGIYTKQRQHSNGVLAMVQRVELPGEWTTSRRLDRRAPITDRCDQRQFGRPIPRRWGGHDPSGPGRASVVPWNTAVRRVVGLRRGWAGRLCHLEAANRRTRSRAGVIRRARRHATRSSPLQRERARDHILRHTFCSHLAMRGAPTRAIQELAGHQDLSTTQRYMHLSPAALDAAIRLLESGEEVASASVEN